MTGAHIRSTQPHAAWLVPAGVMLTLFGVLVALGVGAVPVSARGTARPNNAKAVFAGGCFWSMERPFDDVPGVTATVVGYAGGSGDDPKYSDVNSGKTGYAESVEVTYDPSKVTYEKLLDVYWHNVDPYTREAQFCDSGDEYRTVIFYNGEAERAAAERSRDAIAAAMPARGPIVTQIVSAGKFWPAEAYHQHYADHNAVRYLMYRLGCGRDERLHEIWGDAAEPYVPAK